MTNVSAAALPPTFTTKVSRQLGVHPRDLYRWRDGGQIVELSRGVFRRADAPLASYPDALAVSYRVSRGIVCCLSAAAVHDLTDEMVAAVHVAIPKGGSVPRIDYPPTIFFQFDAGAFELGLETFDAAPGEPVRIYGPARTVVDLMRLRHRLGEPLAYSALRRYLARTDAQPAQLLTYAQTLGVFGPMRVALDVATAA